MSSACAASSPRSGSSFCARARSNRSPRPGALAKDYARDGKGKFFTDHDMYLRNDPIRRFVFESPAGEIAARLMGARKVNLVDDHLLIKEPKTSNPTYWHQDQPY
ncbi:MAG: hypothetical protein Q8P46_00520, partial [Hyphomicrobiales bacterium]|nr:hypothetical protein [Hyphomicrobiales bacterium]